MSKKKRKSNKKVNEFVVYPNIEFDTLDLLKELIEEDELKKKML